jgi:ATP adenylyltransferase
VQEFPNIPYRNFAISLPSQTTAGEVSIRYFKLLKKTKKVLQDVQSEAYNVIATNRWIVLIPRVHVKDPEKGANANAAGMMGMVWVKDEGEVKTWEELGLTSHLKYLGVASSKDEI